MKQSDLQSIASYNPDTGLLSKINGEPFKTILIGAGYPAICMFGSRYYTHCLAFLYMTGEIPEIVDHINGNKQDCRWANLRRATRSENQMNRGAQKNNSTGVKGVDYRAVYFRATVRAKGQPQRCKLFFTLAEAKEWVQRTRLEMHGEFVNEKI